MYDTPSAPSFFKRSEIIETMAEAVGRFNETAPPPSQIESRKLMVMNVGGIVKEVIGERRLGLVFD